MFENFEVRANFNLTTSLSCEFELRSRWLRFPSEKRAYEKLESVDCKFSAQDIWFRQSIGQLQSHELLHRKLQFQEAVDALVALFFRGDCPEFFLLPLDNVRNANLSAAFYSEFDPISASKMYGCVLTGASESFILRLAELGVQFVNIDAGNAASDDSRLSTRGQFEKRCSVCCRGETDIKLVLDLISEQVFSLQCNKFSQDPPTIVAPVQSSHLARSKFSIVNADCRSSSAAFSHRISFDGLFGLSFVAELVEYFQDLCKQVSLQGERNLAVERADIDARIGKKTEDLPQLNSNNSVEKRLFGGIKLRSPLSNIVSAAAPVLMDFPGENETNATLRISRNEQPNDFHLRESTREEVMSTDQWIDSRPRDAKFFVLKLGKIYQMNVLTGLADVLPAVRLLGEKDEAVPVKLSRAIVEVRWSSDKPDAPQLVEEAEQVVSLRMTCAAKR